MESGDFGDLNHRNHRIAAFLGGIPVKRGDFGDFCDLNRRNHRIAAFLWRFRWEVAISALFWIFRRKVAISVISAISVIRELTGPSPQKPQKCSRRRGRASPTLPNPGMLLSIVCVGVGDFGDLETRRFVEISAISCDFRGNFSTSRDAQFRTLIAAMASRFPVLSQQPPRARIPS